MTSVEAALPEPAARRSTHLSYDLRLNAGPLYLRIRADYPFAGARRNTGRRRAPGDSRKPSMVLRSRFLRTGPCGDCRLVEDLAERIDPRRLAPGSRWGRSALVAAAGGFVARAVAGGDYCIASDFNHALVVDYRRRAAVELLNDRAMAALRARDIRCAAGLFLRFVLPAAGAASMHAAGVVNAGGDGFLAAGPSGAGKTTFAGLAPPGYRVLGDDRVVVWRSRGVWRMAPDPFGPLPAGVSGRLTAIVCLRHGSSFGLRPLRWTRVVPAVWRDNRGQWAALPSLLRTRLFHTYCNMFAELPVVEMTFPADRIEWRTLEQWAARSRSLLPRACNSERKEPQRAPDKRQFEKRPA